MKQDATDTAVTHVRCDVSLPSPDSLPRDQASRDRIVSELNRCLIVEAGAGSGKTTVLVNRLAALLTTGTARIEHIAAMTFTRKAAAELRERLLAELRRRAEAPDAEPQTRERLLTALAEQERMFVGTIHSFCASLLRSESVAAGIPAAFEELDQEEDELFSRRCWNTFINRLHQREDKLLTNLRSVGLSTASLRPAYHRLRQYSDVEDWPAPVVARPDPEPVRQSLTKWHQFINEILTPLEGKNLTCKLLLHFRRVRRHARTVDLADPLQFFEHIAYAAKVVKSEYIRKSQWCLRNDDRRIIDCVVYEWGSFVTNQLQPVLAQWQAHRYPIAMDFLRQAVAFTAAERLRRRRLNFQDLLYYTARLLRIDQAARRRCQARWTHLLVDEFQDTDPLQAEVLLFLSDEGLATSWLEVRPRPGSLFIVGDPQQSIYRFRRADLTTYQAVKQVLVAAGGEVLHLTTNFRARSELVDWSNQTFAELFPAAPSPTMPGFQALHSAPKARRPLAPPLLQLPLHRAALTASRAAEEADRIAEFILRDKQRWHRSFSDYLILTRVKERLSVYGEALAKRRIPFQISGSTRLSEMPELRLLRQWLQAVACPHDAVALVALLRGPAFGFSDEQLFAFHQAGGHFDWRQTLPANLPDRERWVFAWRKLRQLARSFRTLPLLAVVEQLITAGGLLARTALVGGGDEAVGNLAKLLGLLRAHRSQLVTVQDVWRLLRHWEEYAERRVGQGGDALDGLSIPQELADAVRVMNLHKAKGLEAAVVFLCDPKSATEDAPFVHVERTQGVSRGWMCIRGKDVFKNPGPVFAQPLDWPQWSQLEQEHLAAEEIRLLYVAATRAAETLIISTTEKEHVWRALENRLKYVPSVDDYLRSISAAAESSATCEEPAWPIPPADTFVQAWQKILVPSESASAIKAWAMKDPLKGLRRRRQSSPAGISDSAEQSLAWGELIHKLLEARWRRGHPPDATEAQLYLADLDLDPELLAEALTLVESVAESALWRRAQQARRCLVEVPIELRDAKSHVLFHGILDLAFEEPGGWVIVDYKTDRVTQVRLPERSARYRPQLAAYAEAWEQVTKAKVAEYGLFWTHLMEYQRLGPQALGDSQGNSP
jgi:ATP-dependent helicase/nuclease subunit A